MFVLFQLLMVEVRHSSRLCSVSQELETLKALSKLPRTNTLTVCFLRALHTHTQVDIYSTGINQH